MAGSCPEAVRPAKLGADSARSWSLGPLGSNWARAHRVQTRPERGLAYILYDSSMSEHAISEARESFSTTINRVAFAGERVVLTRHGRRVAAVVPIADLELLEALEDRRDLDDVRAALDAAGDEPTVGWDEVKAQLGL